MTSVVDPGQPEAPLLLTSSGVPESIDSICLDITAEGVDLEEDAQNVSRALELLGIETVDDDCPASLSITATGSRHSAVYRKVGECWTGWTISAETVLTVDGKVQESWSAEDEKPPPSSIAEWQCEEAGSLLPGLVGVFAPTVGESFRAMWGDLGFFAIRAAAPYVEFPQDVEFTDEVVQLITTRLLAEPTTGDIYGRPLWMALRLWTDNLAAVGQEALVPLLPIAPVLITLLERPQGEYVIYYHQGDESPSRGDSARRDLQQTLENISGESLESPAEWWEWWNDQ